MGDGVLKDRRLGKVLQSVQLYVMKIIFLYDWLEIASMFFFFFFLHIKNRGQRS